MNRLVILGNGFDLVNGLKSRYEDFLVWLINKEIETAKKKNNLSSHILFEVYINSNYSQQNLIRIDQLKDLEDFEIQVLKSKTWGDLSGDEELNLGLKFMLVSKSSFFDILLKFKNWTDIEYAYFDFLKLNQNKGKDFIQELNKHFVAIKNEFVQYLNSDDAKNTYEINSSLRNVINIAVISGTPIAAEYQGHRRRILENGMGEDPLLQETLVLNFNYTHIFRDVLNDFQMAGHVKHISNIHGTVDKPDSIIFGYGDEMTEEFKKFQEANNDELIKHFKSFYYASGDEYLNLLGFINQGAFDVVVIGHSLGLSDRVLLNTIFENDNCKFIHLFHTGEDSHFRKRMALSRHFNDPAKFREKLMPENPNFKMPRK